MRHKGSGKAASCAIAFGIGLIISCFCPTGLMFFIIACIIVGLGIALFKC